MYYRFLLRDSLLWMVNASGEKEEETCVFEGPSGEKDRTAAVTRAFRSIVVDANDAREKKEGCSQHGSLKQAFRLLVEHG